MSDRRRTPLPKEYRALSDEQLVARARRELPYRTRAYEELMRRHDRLMFSVCLRLVGNRHDAEDLTQDIMLKIFSGLHSFEGRSSFKTWMVRVTHNACKDWLKKRAISRQYRDALAREPQEQSTIEYREDRLIEILKELSPADREILTLRFVADLSLQEIAETTELSLSATKMRLYRAIGRLEELAADILGEGWENE
ncbi:MAG: sigma-70 family RNA polymerase sigma factor [Gammaproteobacteria bacterium]|nr:sigma-70 family RNA polymerase sigma factor [Gammaproteobacteria bacterium]MDH5618202.1 sigma-70 family RNA polymerase sigma factor [Gammaproteobacteria bacterium]